MTVMPVVYVLLCVIMSIVFLITEHYFGMSDERLISTRDISEFKNFLKRCITTIFIINYLCICCSL